MNNEDNSRKDLIEKLEMEISFFEELNQEQLKYPVTQHQLFVLMKLVCRILKAES